MSQVYHRSRSSDPSSADGSPVSSGCSTTRLLSGLPSIAIDLIFAHLFLRIPADLPTSSHYPLHGTTHVLLVSRAFRSYAHRFFLHSITLTRPEDFVTFFDPNTGLFAGPEGLERWKYVKRISLVAGVHPPFLAPAALGDPWIVPLAIPHTRRVQQLCILQPRSPKTTYAKDAWSLPPEAADFIRAQQTPEGRKAKLEMYRESHAKGVEARDPNGPPGPTLERKMVDYWRQVTLGPSDDWVDDLSTIEPSEEELTTALNGLIARNVEIGIDPSGRQAGIRTLIAHASPHILRTNSLEAVDFKATFSQDDQTRSGKVDTLVHHYVPSQFEIEPTDSEGQEADEQQQDRRPPLARFYRDVEILAGFSPFRHVHLAGYPTEIIDGLMACIRQEVRGRAWPPRVQRWTWDDAHGKGAYELDLKDL